MIHSSLPINFIETGKFFNYVDSGSKKHLPGEIITKADGRYFLIMEDSLCEELEMLEEPLSESIPNLIES